MNAGRDRRFWAAIAAAALAWSLARAGLDPNELVNTGGWPHVEAFFRAMVTPRVDAAFLRLTAREAGVTLGYAVLGTALAIGIGLVGGIVLTERIWMPLAGPMGRPARAGWALARLAFVVPRSMHEVVFGLILVSILGLDPLVAILAIGVPFGAVTAKVFSELLDEVPGDAERVLRAAGASRLTALLFGTFPQAAGDLVGYGFYRFECALRSAAILGIVGAGGLGFQLAQSFISLRYDEMWTFLWALIVVSGLADRLSSEVRRRHNAAAVEMHVGRPGYAPQRDRFLTVSAAAGALAVPVAVWWLGVDVSTLWSERARTLAGDLAADSWPPTAGAGGLGELAADSIDTIALAVLAIGLAWAVASPLAFVASRPQGRAGRTGWSLRRAAGWLTRFVLLVARAVPPPVWAFVVLLVLFPGLWPGAVALAIYNGGVLGRLQAELVENLDPGPADGLRASGAGPLGVLAYATVPAVSAKFVALGLYRWEVAIRETVVVGVVGAGGLGRRLDEQTSAFDFGGILATIIALLVVTVVVDIASAFVRSSLR